MTRQLLRLIPAVVLVGSIGVNPVQSQDPAPGLLDSVPNATGPAVTLDEAIRLAHQYQPTVVRARTSVNTAEHQKRSSSLGAWLPSINANSSGASTWNEGVSRIDPNTGLPYASYSWAPGGETTQTISVTPGTTTVYTVTVINDDGCVGIVNPRKPLGKCWVSAHKVIACRQSAYLVVAATICRSVDTEPRAARIEDVNVDIGKWRAGRRVRHLTGNRSS